MRPDLPAPPFAAIIVAGGRGMRAGQKLPKQFARWRGKPLLRHSVEAFMAAGADPIVVAIPTGAQEIAADAVGEARQVRLVEGGATRQRSVRNALENMVLHDPPATVLVHDAARPDLPNAVIERVLAALGDNTGAVPVLPVVDSILRIEGDRAADHLDRLQLRRVQTPQGFHFAELLAAHRNWREAPEASDDARVFQADGGKVFLVSGDERLAKLTYRHDFASASLRVRTGLGFDVHRLSAGEELWLGGVRIEHERGLSGHSDADVVLHALVDALLGAIGAGDIGTHFPPSDERWRDAPSSRFVQHAVALVTEAGYTVANVDLTIMCEAPRIGPHRQVMLARIADLLGVEEDRVSVKATTTEGLGFTGRGEGIAAQAVATLSGMGQD